MSDEPIYFLMLTQYKNQPCFGRRKGATWELTFLGGEKMASEVSQAEDISSLHLPKY